MVALRDELPDKAATPQLHAQTLKELGKPTCDAAEIAGELKLDLEQLTKAAEKERERRVVVGISLTSSRCGPPISTPLRRVAHASAPRRPALESDLGSALPRLRT